MLGTLQEPKGDREIWLHGAGWLVMPSVGSDR